jgi:hypothetical protein
VRKHQGQDQTVVEVLEIAAAEREAEIADMLGGGAAALAQARELLKAAASVADVAVALPKSLSGPAKKSAKVTFKDRR